MAGKPKPKPDRAGAKVVPLRRPRKCPICGKDAARETYPFCSKRCADIDLNRWLTDGYSIPAVEADGDTDEGEGGDGKG